MLKFKTYIVLIIAAAVVYGCERQDIGEYENDPRLYFFKGKVSDKSHTTDSMIYSFFFAPDSYTQDTVYLDLRIMGLSSNQARPFTMTQIEPDVYTKAEAGKHFVPFDNEKIKESWWMPANQVQYFMPIILLRDKSLSEQRFELQLMVEENAYFKAGITLQSTFRIIFTSKAEKPTTWDNYWKTPFGTWGERKMWFVMNYLGITDFDDYSTDYAYNTYLKSVAQKQLAAYNANNPTLVEADGTKVTF